MGKKTQKTLSLSFQNTGMYHIHSHLLIYMEYIPRAP